jgi:hypothetical protein
VVSGISAGGINTQVIGTYEKGDEKAMSDNMVELWGNLTNGNIWKMWSSDWDLGLFSE